MIILYANNNTYTFSFQNMFSLIRGQKSHNVNPIARGIVVHNNYLTKIRRPKQRKYGSLFPILSSTFVESEDSFNIEDKKNFNIVTEMDAWIEYRIGCGYVDCPSSYVTDSLNMVIHVYLTRHPL